MLHCCRRPGTQVGTRAAQDFENVATAVLGMSMGRVSGLSEAGVLALSAAARAQLLPPGSREQSGKSDEQVNHSRASVRVSQLGLVCLSLAIRQKGSARPCLALLKRPEGRLGCLDLRLLRPECKRDGKLLVAARSQPFALEKHIDMALAGCLDDLGCLRDLPARSSQVRQLPELAPR